MTAVTQLSVRLGDVLVLDGVSAAFPKGRLSALVGPSGSGKTTLLNVLAGLQAPAAGTIDIDAASIGLVHQSFALLSLLTAAENVEVAGQIAGRPRRQVIDQAAAALKEVGLDERAHHLVEELSGGEQQRVAIARAIVSQPRLLLADEPTAQLDTGNRMMVMTVLRRLAAGGATVIIATHDLDLAEQCDHIIRLRNGRITGE